MTSPKLNPDPFHEGKSFTCPHCKTVAQQIWHSTTEINRATIWVIDEIYFNKRQNLDSYIDTHVKKFLEETKNLLSYHLQKTNPWNYSIATCSSCSNISIWIDKNIVYPIKPNTPPPNQDLDDEIKSIYYEAANIYKQSPKGAAALLRLALQKLLAKLGKKGKNINDDIKELVQEGLSPKLQQALDLVRVIGNNAVHPGQIDLDDNLDIAEKLFQLLNFIAYEMITKPREIEQLYDLHIPQKNKEEIARRDGIK